MKNENMSVWIEEARKAGIDLSMLYQNKLEIYDMLETLQLPTPKRYTLKPEELQEQWVADLFAKTIYFCRLIPYDKEKTRPYRMRVRTIKELLHFYEEQEAMKCIVQLVEKGEVIYSGIIIAGENNEEHKRRGVIEIVKGDGEELAHGKKTPIHARWTNERKIMYAGEKPALYEISIIERALKAIGYPRNIFPGYYEFEIWEKDTLIFRNYQCPETPYGKLPDKIDEM